MDEAYEEFPRLDLSIRPDLERMLDDLEDERLTQQEQQKDAERFRWLCAHAQNDGLSMDGSAYWRVPSFHMMIRAHSFYEAIDLAMKEEQRKNS